MIQVRDHTIKVTEYKGRWTYASDLMCPCRPCYNAHDCGHYIGSGTWIVSMACATNANDGCPSPKPKPEHIPPKRGRLCKRCREG